MNSIRCLIAFGLCIFLFFGQSIGRDRVSPDGNITFDARSEIKVIDSLQIDLSRMDSTICIDGSVVLSFNSDSVFACEWIDVETGKIFSREKTVTLSPKTTTQYQVNLYYFTGELIPDGNFEKGFHFYTEYRVGHKNWQGCEKREAGACRYELYDEGVYLIGKQPNLYHPSFSRIRDHSSGNGNMMIVNGSPTNGTIVLKTTVSVEKDRIYAFSAWGVEVSDAHPAQFHFTINGTQLGSENTTLMDEGKHNNKWQQFYELWKADDDIAEISLVNLSTYVDGNDFAIDDISFASMEKKTGLITVQVLPAVELGKLDDLEVCEENEISVNAKATGSQITGYSWTKDGELLEFTEPLLGIQKAALSDAGVYTCAVSGVCGTKENTFRIDVRERLRTDRLKDTVWPCDKSSVTLSAEVRGYAPVYNWSTPAQSRGWYNLQKKSVVNNDVRWSRDLGTYVCRVSNLCGSIDIYRTIEAGEPIKITDWPGDQNVCTGSTLPLKIETNFVPDIIRWSGPGIDGWATTPEIVLSDIQEEDVGVYYCQVLDACGAYDTKNFILKVLPPLWGLTVGKDTMVCENGRAVLGGEAYGMKLRYSWEGPDNFTATSQEISIDPVTPARAGTYILTVTDSCGNSLTDSVHLVLLNEYEDIQITPNLSVCPGDGVTLAVSGGKSNMVYEWQTPGGNTYSGKILQIQAFEEGEYTCRIQGICPAVNKSLTLKLKERLIVASGENHFRVCAGEHVSFIPQLTAGSGVVCEWWKNGVFLREQREWTISSVGEEDAGWYECRITSDCGDTTLFYELQLKKPVQITGYLPERYVRPGEKFVLFVNATGEEGMTYEWWLDGQLLNGEHGSRIGIQAPAQSAVLEYICRVSGCNTEEAVIRVCVRDYTDLQKDTTVALCTGQNYVYRAVDTLPEECEQGRLRQYWMSPGKGTVTEGTVLTLTGFQQNLIGEYVYIREGDCGRKEIHLWVDSIARPRITHLLCEQAVPGEDGAITVCYGADVLLTAEVEAEGMLIYEWSKDGVKLDGQQGASLALSGVSALLAGKYTCRVISPVCGEDSREIILKVNKNRRVSGMDDQVLCPGQAAELKVLVEASTPSEFIWSGPGRLNWSAASDGYIAFYRNNAVDHASDGIYRCIVDNVCGRDTVDIRLKVEQEPEITDVPMHDTLCPGGETKLEVKVDQENISCSWILPDSRVVEGEYLWVKNFSRGDIGTYRYRVETPNACFLREGEIYLEMREELEEPLLSKDTAVCKGRAVMLSAYATGKDVEYEWWGPQGFRATGQDILITSVEEANSGVYEVMVTDVCNKTGKRGQIRLSLLKEFDDLTISRDTGICKGSDIGFSVFGGVEGLTYEWIYQDRPIGDRAELRLKDVPLEAAGTYTCRISGHCQQITENVTLQVYDSLKAERGVIQPVCERENSVLEVHATGQEVRYLWLKDGEEVGDRSARLVLNDVIPSDSGIYECQVNSRCGHAQLTYEFRLKEKTRIKRHSTDRILCEDDAYDLFVEAQGENNRYLWTRNGEVLADVGSKISCPASGQADTLIYSCFVEGDCGRDSVSIQVMIGEFRKIWRDRADTLCEGSNYKYNADVIPFGIIDDQEFVYCWKLRDSVVSKLSLLSLEEVKPEDAGVYTCTVSTLPGGPTSLTATVHLTVDVIRLPQLEEIADDLFLVEGDRDSVWVRVSGDSLTYKWMKDGQLTGNKEACWHFEPVIYEDRGEYRVTVENACGHFSRAVDLEVWKKTVIVYPQERDDSVCLLGDIQLDVLAWGEEGLLYKWYLDGNPVDAPFVQPLKLEGIKSEDQGTYICIVAGRGGSDTCKINLKVMSLPEVKIDGQLLLCRDDSELLQKYSGWTDADRADFFWSVDGGEIRGGSNGENANVYWDKEQTGNLNLKVTSLMTGCSQEERVAVVWNMPPDVNLSVPSEVGYCRDSLLLDRAYPWGGSFYINGSKGNVVSFTDKNAEYTIAYQYKSPETGCTSVSRDTVRVAAAPLVTLASDSIISGWCVPVVLEVKEHTPGTLDWQGKGTLDLTDLCRAVFKTSAYIDGWSFFRVVLTDDYGCQALDSTFVKWLPSPRVELMEDTLIGICNELTITAGYDTQSPREIVWEPVGAVEQLTPYTAEIVEKEAGDRLFFLSVTDSYGCIGRDTVKVTIVDAPALEGGERCIGDSICVNAAIYRQYTWSDGYTGEERCLKEAGGYRLNVVDRFGCMGEAEYLIRTLPVVALPDTMIFEGEEMIFTVKEAGPYGPYDYYWQDGSAGDSFEATEEGYYRVKVTDNIGCVTLDTAFLEVRKKYIAAPDAFLPNSSGENSRFYLKEVNFADRFEMFIYDRWGELLFKTNEIGFKGGWDGTFKGIACQPGAYVWVAFVNGKEVGRGTLMLVK